jgi:hypothetical protein
MKEFSVLFSISPPRVFQKLLKSFLRVVGLCGVNFDQCDVDDDWSDI